MSDVATAPAPPVPATPSSIGAGVPLAELVLELDTHWRSFAQLHRRKERVEEIDAAIAAIRKEAMRLVMIERFVGRRFEGDAAAVFAECVRAAARAGLGWPELVEIFNKASEART